jgi:chromatin assembly factor 1 subunit B
VYGFLKSDVTQPAFMLPGIKSYATVIKFNPHLYQKKNEPEKPPALLDLPYRIIFCVGTMEQVLIYSTECIYPLAVVGNMHYGTMNDFAWDYSGRRLLGASSDGYISMINFNGESSHEILGEKLPNSEVPEKLRPLFEALDSV